MCFNFISHKLHYQVLSTFLSMTYVILNLCHTPSGLAQCAELCWQLRGQADRRQVPGAKVALQHNIGLGGAVVVTLYRMGFPQEARWVLCYDMSGSFGFCVVRNSILLHPVLSVCITTYSLKNFFCYSHRTHVAALPTSSGSGLEGFKAYPVFKEIEKHLQEVHQHAITNRNSYVNLADLFLNFRYPINVKWNTSLSLLFL